MLCRRCEVLIASDIPAILKYTRDIYYLDNGEVVHVKGGDIKIYNSDRQLVDKKLHHVDWDIEAAERVATLVSWKRKYSNSQEVSRKHLKED